MVDNGADLQVVQEMINHSHLSQTTQYLHLLVSV
ncbi:MAG: tyrosine-type recombinase/integrase [Saprospiraceae bacterium]|nr:tyrosine-type recombinase/integrase [Saprospiraceae bacterium]